MCNGGGNIFRFLGGTSSLPELEQYFEVARADRLRPIAEAFGYAYFEACDASTLRDTLPQFYACRKQAIMAVRTPAQVNADLLRHYFRM